MPVESIGNKFGQELDICLNDDPFVRVDPDKLVSIKKELNAEGYFRESGKTYRIVLKPEDYDNSSRIVKINISEELRQNLLQEITKVMRLQKEIQSLNSANLTQTYGFFDFSLNFYSAPLCSKYLGQLIQRQRRSLREYFARIYGRTRRGLSARR